MLLVMLGFPGAGKGTQTRFLADILCVPSVSSGDLFRRHQREGTPLGIQVQSYVDSGLLVPDEITIGMVLEEVSTPPFFQGFVLDGFPRNVNQAEALDRALNLQGMCIDCALLIDVTQEALADRLGKRLVCNQCQTIYHSEANPPRTNGICDSCNGTLGRRSDDEPEAVTRRLLAYQEESAPVVDFYARAGKLATVDGTGTVQEVRERIEEAISSLDIPAAVPFRGQ
jgi:adenylate kinase